MPAAPIKMRVMCASGKGKVRTYATAIGEAFKCLVNDVPPAYPCDKERLVVIVASLKGDPSDKLRLFCSELNNLRAFNVALVVEGKDTDRAVGILKTTLKEAGTNVVEDVYSVKAGFLSGSKITLEERTAIVKWVEGVIANLNVK